MTDDDQSYRRRYERERSARLQAEAIAERAIADLTASNEALDRRVRERTAELEVALERLETTDLLKSTFVRGLAHEMSSPLHAIHGLVELVDERTDDLEIQASAKLAAQAATRLNHALRTLLEFAALTAGDVETTRADVRLGAYADRVVDRWRLPAARSGLLLVSEVKPDPSVLVDVDEARLDQIVDALIDNAIRFGRTPVSLRFEHVAGPEPRLDIEVSDSGPGIPEEMQDRIFEAFERGRDATEGFGVGLTLARAIAELLDGRLDLDSDSSGSTFLVQIPLSPDGVDRS